MIEFKEPFHIVWLSDAEEVSTWRRLRAKVFDADLRGIRIVRIVDAEGRLFSAEEILAVPINDLGYPIR